jgi:hypothetical protein
MPSSEEKLRVLVRHSAAEKDVALARELLQHLEPLKRFAGVDVWSEARIRPGDDWRDEIRRAIDQADVALLLLSSDFLAADGLMDVEVPRLLERHRAGALRVIPVLMRSCLWEAHPWVKDLRPLPRGEKPVGSFSADARDEVLTEVAKEIVSLAVSAAPPAQPAPAPTPGTRWPAKLRGAEVQDLVHALLSAFPSRSALAQMLRFGLDRNLDEIAGQGPLRDTVFELVQHAEAQGFLPALFDAALAAAPGNPDLRALAAGRRA